MHDGKLKTLDDLAAICDGARRGGKRVALCHGAFDLLHPGHIRHLEAAKKLADVLVVTLTEDRFIRKGPGRPAFNERLRAESVGALAAVDHVALCPSRTAIEAIQRLRPDYYVKGQDYRDGSKDVTGAIEEEVRAVRDLGGEFVCTDELQFSSTKLLNDFFDVLTDEQRAYLDRVRAAYTADDVVGWLSNARATRVLIVGEAIIDEYHYCLPDAMSNKTPILSCRFEHAEVYPGGSLAVANALGGWCRDVRLIAGVGGQDADDDDVTSHLPPSVRCLRLVRPDGPTVRKRRFVHRFLNQKLFEVTLLRDAPIDADTERRFIDLIDAEAADADLTIVLDFGHGMFTPAANAALRERARFLAVNAQINSSNRGFNSVKKYRGADYISVDEYELRLPFGDRYGPLEGLVRRLADDTGCSRINVTLGDRGTMYFDGGSFHVAPTLTNRVVDPMGAGDALLGATALLVQAGAPPALVPFVGNCVGGLMAQIVGHRRPVDFVDVCTFIGTLLK